MEEHLIEFVKNNQFLYDKSKKHHKNILLRDKKFDELSKKLNVPAKKLKDRWRTLRDRFYKELKNGNGHLRSRGSSSFPKKKWKWLERLSFLKDTVTANTSTLENDVKDEGLVNGNGASTRSRSCEKYEALTPPPADSLLSDFSFAEAYVDNERKVEEDVKEPKSEMAQVVLLAKGVLAEPNDVKLKTAAQFFFNGLAKQVDDANLPPRKLAYLQIEVMKLMNKLLYEDD